MNRVRTEPQRPDASVLPWYAEWFGRDYLEVYKHRDDAEARRQIDLMERALRPFPGARILDLACGAGRHSIELARRGYDVVGVDLSQDLLDRAAEEAAAAQVEVRLLRSDMREVVERNAFDVVVNFFTSFGYFETDEENLRVLAAIREALCAGGSWMLDYLNRERVIATLVPHDEKQVGDIHLAQERWVDLVRGRINKTLRLRTEGGVRVYRESVRMYSFPELVRMAEHAGLRATQVYGSYDGDAYGSASPRLVIAGTTSDGAHATGR